MEEAIETGLRTLQLADQFLEHHQIEQQISPWSGKVRNIHFMKIKRNSLADNLKMLQTDMHEIQQQYQIQPSSTAITPSRNTSRHKRGFNFDVTMDVGQCLKTIVDGVISLFSSPTNIDKVQKRVDKILFKTSRLDSEFNNYTKNIDMILIDMKRSLVYDISQAHHIVSITSAINIADNTISNLLASITPLHSDAFSTILVSLE